MHLLLALRDSSVEQLAKSMGLEVDQMQQMLDKLVATGYVIQTVKGGMPSYRVALIAPCRNPAGEGPRAGQAGWVSERSLVILSVERRMSGWPHRRLCDDREMLRCAQHDRVGALGMTGRRLAGWGNEGRKRLDR